MQCGARTGRGGSCLEVCLGTSLCASACPFGYGSLGRVPLSGKSKTMQNISLAYLQQICPAQHFLLLWTRTCSVMQKPAAAPRAACSLRSTSAAGGSGGQPYRPRRRCRCLLQCVLPNPELIRMRCIAILVGIAALLQKTLFLAQ